METAVVLFNLALAAVLLTMLATLPVVPGYLEGAAAPTDVSDLYAASERLWMAGAGLLLLAIVKHWAGAAARPPALFILCACAGVAVTVYRACEVVAIITVWARHVHGEHATFYWVAAIATVLVIGAMPVVVLTV